MDTGFTQINVEKEGESSGEHRLASPPIPAGEPAPDKGVWSRIKGWRWGWVGQVALFVALVTLFFNGRPLNPLVEGFTGAAWAGRGKYLLGFYWPPLKISLALLPLVFGLFWLAHTLKRGKHCSGPAPRSAANPLGEGVFIPLVVALGATLFSALVQVLVLDRIPHVQDSINYLWQARVFADRMIRVPSHPLAEFFSFRFMVNDGSWYSLFQPGWPAILALGVLAGVPWLVNPVIGGLTVMMVYLIGRRVFSGSAGVWAAVLLGLSPFFLFMNASMMAHPAGALLASVAVWSWLMGSNYMGELISGRRSPAAPVRGGGRLLALLYVVCGLALGGLFLVRAMDGVLVALVIGVHGLWLWLTAREYRGLRFLFLMVVPVAAILTGGLQFVYNQIQTGAPLVWPQDVYFGVTEPVPDCHRPGFGEGIGCQREHGPDLAGTNFTPARAVQVTSIRTGDLARKLWGAGLGVVLFLAGVLVPLGRRRGRGRGCGGDREPGVPPGESAGGVAGANPLEVVLIWAWALVPVAGYFFYYYHGNCFGPRYYFTGLPAMALMAGSAVTAGWGWLRERYFSLCARAGSSRDESGAGADPGRLAGRVGLVLFLSALLVSLVGGVLLHSSAYGIPAFWKEVSGARGWGYWGVDRRIQVLAEEQSLKNSVVIIPVGRNPDRDDSGYRFGFVAVDHDPDVQEVVVVRDHGKEHNRQLFQYFQGRDFYRYSRGGGKLGRLVPMSRAESRFDPGVIHVEGESKFPVHGVGGHAKPVKPHEPHLAAVAGRGHVLEFTCSPGRTGGWFSFNQYVFEPGEYAMEAGFVTGPGMGRAALVVNGVAMEGEMDGRDQYGNLSSWRSGDTISLPSGVVQVVVQVKGDSPAGDSCKFALDYVRFRKVAPGGPG